MIKHRILKKTAFLCLSILFTALMCFESFAVTFADIPKPYRTIVYKYKVAVDNKWKANKVLKNDMSILTTYPYQSYVTKHPEDRLKNIGFCILDIDGDGSEELLIGNCGSDYPRKCIYDIYAVSTGSVKHILSSIERDRYHIGKDGLFLADGSAGAAYSTVSWNRIDTATGKLTEVYSINTDGVDDDGNIICYSEEHLKSGKTVRTDISNDEFMNRRDKFLEEDTIQLDMIPLSEINYR